MARRSKAGHPLTRALNDLLVGLPPTGSDIARLRFSRDFGDFEARVLQDLDLLLELRRHLYPDVFPVGVR